MYRNGQLDMYPGNITWLLAIENHHFDRQTIDRNGPVGNWVALLSRNYPLHSKKTSQYSSICQILLDTPRHF